MNNNAINDNLNKNNAVIPSNAPLGKKPHLGQKQLKTLRMVLQQVNLPLPHNRTYFYNIMEKQTNWGLSSNTRLVILNIQQKSIKYLSQIPQGYLPFQTHEQINALKQKEKIQINKVKNFKCYPEKGKISTMVIQWDATDKKGLWRLTLGSSKIMNDWVGLVGSVANGTFSKDKYEEINKINAATGFGGQLGQGKQQQNQQSQQQLGNSKVYSTQQNDPNNKNIGGQPLVNENLKPGQYFQQQKNGQKISSNDPIKSNIPVINTSKPIQQKKKSEIPNKQDTQTKKTTFLGDKNTQSPSLGKKVQTTQTHNQNMSLHKQQQNPTNKKLYVPKLGQLDKPSQDNLKGSTRKFQNQYFGGENSMASNVKQGKDNQGQSRKTAIEQKINNTEYHQQNQNKQNQNKKIDTQSRNRQASFIGGKGPNVQNITGKINQSSYETYKEQSPLKTTQQRGQNRPNDFIDELKYRRQHNPKNFNLTNQLSTKKFEPILKQNEDSYYNGQKVLNNNNSGGNKGAQQLGPSKNIHLLVNKERDLERIKTNKTNIYNAEGNYQQTNHVKSSSRINRQSRSKLHPQPSSLINQYDPNQDDISPYEQNPYKPSTNFPDSNRNLTKIRSDYLQKRNGDSYEQRYPHSTTKNNSRLLAENQIFQSINNQYQPQDRYHNLQRKREQILQNLNKANSSYLSPNENNANYWNQMWLQTSNSQKKLQVHENFIKKAQNIVKQISQQLPLPRQYRHYQPIEIKENIHYYLADNIHIALHFFEHAESLGGDSEDNINVDAPLLYNQYGYEDFKRQFYNYNLILSVTHNQGKIKVPLCCYFEYRGLLAVCRADIPKNYREIDLGNYREEFEALENIIKVRFLIGSFNIYEGNPYRGGENKFVMLWNLRNLIPSIPNLLKFEASYFRKEFLLQYDEILEDLESSTEAHAFTLKHIVTDTVSKLQMLQCQILHTRDITKLLHKQGLSLSYLPDIIRQTKSLYFKKIFVSEIIAGIFTSILRSELNHAFSILPLQSGMHNITNDQLNSKVVDSAHILINDLFSYSLTAESIWKLMVQEANKRYKLIVSKEDILPGYLLSAITEKCCIKTDFNEKSFERSKPFFIHENTIPRKVFLRFQIHTRRYDMESICPMYSKCKQMLDDDPSPQNYDQMEKILSLKNRTNFPSYFNPIKQEIKAYLCNFIPYTQQLEYQNLDIYEFMYEEPITSKGIEASLLAVKWLIKKREIQRANQIFQLKFYELGFWVGQHNTAISEFYDFFSMYFASIGDFEESICLAKSSLVNITKILGKTALPAADKHYQLGNILFKINKKEQALRQYLTTKKILHSYDQTQIPQYGTILLKIALLELNFGQLTSCAQNAIQAQKIFQLNGNNQNEQIQCFEILARVYEILKRPQDMRSLCQACSKIFDDTENPKNMQKMLKIILYPLLSSLSSQEQKSLTQVLLRLQDQTQASEVEAFNYFAKKSVQYTESREKNSFNKKITRMIENATLLVDEVNRRDLLRKHMTLQTRTSGQAQEMLSVLEALGAMIGYEFMLGAMKQSLYE